MNLINKLRPHKPLIGVLLYMSMIAICAISGTFLTGCGDLRQDWQIPEKVEANNAYSLKHPVVVGTNDVGQTIKVYKVRLLDEYYYHYVYVVDNTVTINHQETHGKQHPNVVRVLINGQQILAEEPVSITIATNTPSKGN